MSFQFLLNSDKYNKHITSTLLQRHIWKSSYSLLGPRMASGTAFCCNITFIWVSLVSFAVIINCVNILLHLHYILFRLRGKGIMKCQKEPLLTIPTAVAKEKSLCWRYRQLWQRKSLMSPHPKKVRLVNLNQDVIFCNTEVIVHKEFISLCQTVSLHCYWEVLQRLRKQVCWNRQEWWWRQNWLAHHAPPYTVLSVQWFLVPETWLQFLTFCIPLIWLLVKFSFFLIIRLQLWGHFFKDVFDTQGEYLTHMWFQKSVVALLSVLAEMLELLGHLVPIMKGNAYFVIESVWELWICHCLFISICTGSASVV